jgi:hypothetical protein
MASCGAFDLVEAAGLNHEGRRARRSRRTVTAAAFGGERVERLRGRGPAYDADKDWPVLSSGHAGAAFRVDVGQQPAETGVGHVPAPIGIEYAPQPPADPCQPGAIAWCNCG